MPANYKSKNVTADCPRIPYAAGLEATQGSAVPMTYSTVSFTSKRQYADDSEGWTTVKRVGKRKQRHVHATEYYMY
jgi:hypothetical protein